MEIKTFVIGPFSNNSYLITNGNDGFVIDPAIGSEKIIKYAKSKQINIKAILLTHAHFDHIAGINMILQNYIATIYVHFFEEDWLFQPKLNGSAKFQEFEEISLKIAPILLKDEEVLNIVEQKIEVIHTPGHTPGSVTYKIDNYLFTGDTLFKQSIGRTDLFGGNYHDLILSIQDKLFEFPDETIILPGHGPKTTIGFEKDYNPYVTGLLR